MLPARALYITTVACAFCEVQHQSVGTTTLLKTKERQKKLAASTNTTERFRTEGQDKQQQDVIASYEQP